MSPLPILKPKRVLQALLRLGFIRHHQKGSHLVLKHGLSGRRVVIPMHAKDLPRGTLGSILEQAGISLETFLRQL